MSLNLDARQRAMLAEMGVRLDGWPQPEAAPPAPACAALPPPRAARPAGRPVAGAAALAPADSVAGAPQATRVAAAADRPARSDPSPALPAVAVAAPGSEFARRLLACQACAQGVGRRRPVWQEDAADLRAHWLVLGDAPDQAQEQAGEPFVGDAGRLLDNMLRWLQLSRDAREPQRRFHRSLALKCRPALPTPVDAAALRACTEHLRAELQRVQPKIILAMGSQAMRLLLAPSFPQGLTLPLAKVRGRVWHFDGIPVVVTYAPAYLVAPGPDMARDKARAWADLCLAAQAVGGSAGEAGAGS